MRIYDVCCDYSLSLAPDNNTAGSKAYRWFPRLMSVNGRDIEVSVGWHKRDKETHYLKTDSEVDLRGLYI